MNTSHSGNQSVLSVDAPPACPRCSHAMVNRVAAHGSNKGGTFWGCSRFPKCRAILAKVIPRETSTRLPQSLLQPVLPPDNRAQPQQQHAGNAFIPNKYSLIERLWRWWLELKQPDATGGWQRDDRRMILNYIYKRDGRRCGLCAGEMVIKGAQIEHIVPKIFAVFDIQAGGLAATGTQFQSLLHKLDNLQPAHSRCNKRKGNTPDIAKWRDPYMQPLGVAIFRNNQRLALPWSRM